MVIHRVTGRREPQRRQFAVPHWAERIEVEERGEYLVVSGSALAFKPIPGDNLDDCEADFLDGFDVARRLSRAQRKVVPHLEFASAHTQSEQIQFVRRFGPVLATRAEYPPDRSDVDAPDLLVYQDLKVLELEQKLFASLLDLICRLAKLDGLSRSLGQLLAAFDQRYTPVHLPNELGIDPVQLGDLDKFIMGRQPRPYSVRQHLDCIRHNLRSIHTLMSAYPEHLSFEMGAGFEDVPRPFDWHPNVSFDFVPREDACIPTVLGRAHMLLCDVLNQFPLDLYFQNGVVQQLPSSGPLGIRPLLYFMLREEYLERREIRMCANPNCGRYLVADDPRTTYCHHSCANNDRQRRSRARAKEAREVKSPRKRAGNKSCI